MERENWQFLLDLPASAQKSASKNQSILDKEWDDVQNKQRELATKPLNRIVPGPPISPPKPKLKQEYIETLPQPEK
jgi:hypothetical protein